MPIKRTSEPSNSIPAVVGFRVKSGWASVVVLGGSLRTPSLLYRGRVELSDPRVPRSRQPYHAGFGTLQKDNGVLRRLVELVHRCTQRSMAALMRQCRSQGYAPRAVALVVGSTIEPDTISNEHIRAHAHEAQLFRTALESGARRQHLACRVIRERDITAAATVELRRSRRAITKFIANLGRAAGKPWRSEQKTAVIAAWLVLAQSLGTQRPNQRLKLTARVD